VPVNILVADDSVTMRRILELTLAGEDTSITAVDNGDAAIAKAGELLPDIVLADISMHTDGYKVASAIKSTPGLERTAVIILSSQKNPYDEAKGKAAGVDDHVVKPFDTQHVIDKIKRVIAQPRAAAPRAAAAPASSARGGRSGTIAFERSPLAPAPAPVAHAPAPPAPVAQRPMAAAPAPRPAAPAPVAPSPVAAAVAASGSDLARKLDGLGLNPEQIQGVLSLSREVIERVVWEVVPDLAETLIKEEIRRLTQ
jgi:CheY-like chemotaxis protein